MRLYARGIFSLLCILVASSIWADDGQPNLSDLPYRSDMILVKIKSDYLHDFALAGIDRFGSHIVQEYTIVPHLYLMKLPTGATLDKAMTWYMNQAGVEYAEPDYTARSMGNVKESLKDYPSIKTLDPLYGQQWALENNGQSGGAVDADINAPESWLIQTGSQTPIIGIIDSGVDYNHNDLVGNLWHNSTEIAGNGLDDDANGYIDDVFGINSITGTGNPLDDFHHGTRVAGIIGAQANNSLGISGVLQTTSMISCKFLNNVGTGNLSDAIECIEYFSNLKTRFYSPENIVAINNSWVLNTKSQALENAIGELRAIGIIFVAAAGNAGSDNDFVPTYPATYPVSNVISVAATDRNDLKPSFSNYGKSKVHVAAPGGSIISTLPSQNYGTSSGSSLAAPHVTGLIGLLAAEFPGLSWSQLKNLAIAGGEVLPNLQSITVSSRRIRGADEFGVGSLTCIDQVVSGRLEPANTSLVVATNSPILLRALHIVCGNPNGDVTLYDDGITSVVLEDTGFNGDDYAGDGVYSLNWIPTIAGDYVLDFGNGDQIDVHVYDPSTWSNYNISIDGAFTSESIIGTSLGGGNETLATLTSPFPIYFGGDAHGFTTLYISSNGAISFTDNFIAPPANTNLPNTTRSTLVAPFWDDLTFTVTGAGIYYQVLGFAPSRKLVIEWRNFKHFNATGTGTFQIVFYEGSPNFRMAYSDTDLGSGSYNSGKSATVGVQLSPTLYKLHSFLNPHVPSNRSLLYTLAP